MPGGAFDPWCFDPACFDVGYWDTVVSDGIAGAWSISVDGGRGAGVDVDGLHYPFVDPDESLEGVFADAWLAHATTTATPPLSLRWGYGFDGVVNGGVLLPGSDAVLPGDPTPTHAVDALIVDARGAVVFDSTFASSYRATPCGPRFVSHEWTAADAVCRIVQQTAVRAVADVRLLPRVFRPIDGRLDERASEIVPSRVKQLSVAGQGGFSGLGAFAAGFNVAFTTTTFARGLRRVNRIVVDVIPGAGAGAAPCAATGPAFLSTLSGVPGDPRHNVSLIAKDCSFVRRVPTTPGAPPRPALLYVGDDCTPCLDCSKIVAFQSQVLAVWAVFQQLAAEAQHAFTGYEDGIAQAQAAAACPSAGPVQVSAIVHDGLIDVVASYTASATCVYDLELVVVDTASPATTLTYVAGSANRTTADGDTAPYEPDVTGNTVAAWFDAVPPGGTAVFRYQLSFPGNVAPTTPVFVTIAATATAGKIVAPTASPYDATLYPSARVSAAAAILPALPPPMPPPPTIAATGTITVAAGTHVDATVGGFATTPEAISFAVGPLTIKPLVIVTIASPYWPWPANVWPYPVLFQPRPGYVSVTNTPNPFVVVPPPLFNL